MALEELSVPEPDDVRSCLFAWGYAPGYGIVVGNPHPHPLPSRLADISLRDCFQAMGQLVPKAKDEFERSLDAQRSYALAVQHESGEIRMVLRKDEPGILGFLIVNDRKAEHVILSFEVKSDVDQVRGYTGVRGVLCPIVSGRRSTD